MSREALQESLSAVMDNEADELELRRVLAACGEDVELRATWSRYQLARSAMHRETALPKMDIAASVSAALASESAPVVQKSTPWKNIGRLAVAASVTLAVLAGVRLYHQDDGIASGLAQQGATPQVTVPQVQGPAVLASYDETEGAPQVITNAPAGQNWHEQRLPGYLRQHAQQSQGGGADSALPYARAASLESR
ncbi:Sigma factor AlgU negative regulatory protein [compost metagenome]